MRKPKIGENVYLAPGAKLVGEVSIGDNSCVLFNAVLRGDFGSISIGRGTNVQDNCVIHASDVYPVTVGDNVTVGHGSIVHGCTVESNVLVGMGSIIMNGAVIGEGSVIGAGSLISEGKQIPPRSLVIGSPGRVVRTLSEEEAQRVALAAEHYSRLRQSYIDGALEIIGGE